MFRSQREAVVRFASGVATLSLVSLFVPASAAAQGPPSPDPLFQDHEPLQLRLVADFDGLRGDREEENDERDGVMMIEGEDDTFPIELRTRGRFRLQSRTCRFPPLRLDVPRRRMEGTAFDNQDKLKLVTHCRDDDRYEQNTLKEYLVYRLYNLLTDQSFQVRLARITYVDTSGEEDPIERWGFLIESEEALAERLGGEIIEERPNGVHPSQIPPDVAGRVDLFQFMVGNTDYSIYSQHNVVGVEPPQATLIPVPYDFDWTGFVDAPYARPDPSLDIRNVRQRVYRGLCRPGLDYAALYDRFVSQREAMTSLIRGMDELDEDERSDAVEFLDDFWETIGDQRQAGRAIERACRTF